MIPRRRNELAIAAAAVGAAAILAAGSLLWRFAFDSEPWDIPWPPRPRMDGWEAFNLYSWIVPVTVAVAACVLVSARWRRPRLAATCAVLLCLQTAMVYVPYAACLASRIDRMRGLIREPMRELRELVSVVVVTLALAGLYVAVAQLRHTRVETRRGALTIAVVVNGVLLHHVWLLMFLPLVHGWWPADSRRTDLLVPFRPCRGAMVLRVEEGRVLRYGRVDDVWLHFDDPRDPGPPSRAVSLTGEWTPHYFWLNDGDLAKLSVRVDDPAVIRCDSSARSEPVAPEPWHRLGLSW